MCTYKRGRVNSSTAADGNVPRESYECHRKYKWGLVRCRREMYSVALTFYIVYFSAVIRSLRSVLRL